MVAKVDFVHAFELGLMLELSGSVALHQLVPIHCFVKLARVLLELQWITWHSILAQISRI